MFANATMSRRARVTLGAVGIVVGITGVCLFVERREAARFRESRRAPETIDTVVWEGRYFRAGNRVRIAKWAGTFKPEQTGAQHEVDAGKDQVGVIIRAERRVSTEHLRIDANEPIQIVRVRWLPQRWKVSGRSEVVELPEFEATIHVSHLEFVP